MILAATRRYRFPAAHVLRIPGLPDAENERIYGKCANPGGHGHNYAIEVTVGGPLDPRSGQVVDPERLDALVRERVVERFSHRLLNADPAFERAVPTAENIARVVRDALAEPVADLGARILRVGVVETPRNRFETGELR